MHSVLPLQEIRAEQVGQVGGKGANLGELSRVQGIRVPPGFCVTTEVFRAVVTPAIDRLIDRLPGRRSGDLPDERETSGALGAQLRELIENLPIPDALAAAVRRELDGFPASTRFAVRSSATAEDLPGASFAGQHDSFLEVEGADAVLEGIRRCWSSLFTDRAMAYRVRNGFEHRSVAMAVVVQQMVAADAAGVMFTADPLTSNRSVATVEAVRGLGEALVSGLMDPDVYSVTRTDVTGPAVTDSEPVLTPAQVLALVQSGRRIEAALGGPQDIEWCLAGEDFWFVQSRPITTVFPVPETTDDDHRVYLSVGHQQMMTDAMKPLGLSIWQLTTMRPMAEAGGRLFVDVTRALESPADRDGLLEVVGRGDPLIRDALQTVLARDGFLRELPSDAPTRSVPAVQDLIAADPELVDGLIEDNETALAALEREVAQLSGQRLFERLLAAFEDDKRILFDPRSLAVITAGMDASWWLEEHLADWLGERGVADTLSLSAPHNITAEMGLELLALADTVRPQPQVVSFLRDVESGVQSGEDLLGRVAELAGGERVRDAFSAYLARYGMRCPGEIDITRPRWSEDPAALVPAVLAAVRTAEPGDGLRRFADGVRRAADKEREVLDRVAALPEGAAKAVEVKQMVDRVRAFAGYREYPKYGKIARAAVYRRALLRETDRLVQCGVLQDRDDSSFLRFEELRQIVVTGRLDPDLGARIELRRREFRTFASLTPPRVLTSDGECLDGAYRRDDVPPGALTGLAVSTGIVEGRARVVLDMTRADLEAGDILVTRFTDPSWTPMFVVIAGLVTEVGGRMTHGAVIAREYGLPAVVGVQEATRLVRDGQRIRLDGSAGWIELLDQHDATVLSPGGRNG